MNLLHFILLLETLLFSVGSLAQEAGNRTEFDAQQTIPGTGIAAVNSVIREARFEGHWGGGQLNDTIATAKANTSIAAASDDLAIIRVYYLTPNNTLGEAASDSEGKWYSGSLNSYNIRVAPHSKLAAAFLSGNRSPSIRIYAQLQDDSIQEFGYDAGRGWRNLENFGPALPGTAIAAETYLARVRTSNVRVYFQATNRHVVERVHDGGSWSDGGMVVRAAKPRTALAATSFLLRPGNTRSVRVYYSTEADRILEKGTDGGNRWYDGAFQHSSIPGSQIAAVDWGNGGVFNIRVYIQDGAFKTGISEWAWFQRSWRRGTHAIPPA
ncbi:hypothetical protein FQN49_008464 [Arthroderma sp. PD_2]|nr:hypothetical protein FQN49_008464 [Arthroderma sp. PD_2]